MSSIGYTRKAQKIQSFKSNPNAKIMTGNQCWYVQCRIIRSSVDVQGIPAEFMLKAGTPESIVARVWDFFCVHFNPLLKGPNAMQTYPQIQPRGAATALDGNDMMTVWKTLRKYNPVHEGSKKHPVIFTTLQKDPDGTLRTIAHVGDDHAS